MNKLFIFCLWTGLVSAFLLPESLHAEDLYARIDSLLQGKKLTAGIAAEYGDRTFSYRAEEDFPLMSVFKVHVAMTVSAKLAEKRISPDTVLHIDRSEILQDTYSPLREKFGIVDLDLRVRELIRYAVAESDNNACDILIRFIGGVGEVDRYIRTLGIEGFRISETEASMHADLRNAFLNRSTPNSMNRVLKILEQRQDLYRTVLDAMAGTVTGSNKIKAGVPGHLAVLHKTGSSDRIDGIKTADNDAAIIRLPRGEGTCYLTVFLKESGESDETNAAVIAGITREVLRSFGFYHYLCPAH